MMRSVPVNVFMSGILKALEDGEKAFGISVNPFLQHLHAMFDGKSGEIGGKYIRENHESNRKSLTEEQE